MWNLCKVIFLLLLGYMPVLSYNIPDSSIVLSHLPLNGLPLNKGWKYMPGDNQEWASPSWNDRNWQSIYPTEDIHHLPALWQSNIGWLRLHFSLDSSLRGESLALLLEQTGASEIYLNGRLIGKYGEVGSQQDRVRAVSPAFGEVISLQPDKAHRQVLAVRFALEKDIPYVNFAGKYNPAMALRVMEMKAVRELNRSNTYTLDYIKSSVFFIMALLHLVLFYFSPGRKANLYFFIFSLLCMLNFLLSGFTIQYVQMVATKMYLLIFIFLLCTSSYFFFLMAAYSIFKQERGFAFWLIATAFFLSLPLFLWFYNSGWLFGLILYPILVFTESARITLLADRKKTGGVRIVTYGAAAFLILYPLALAFIFGFLPAGSNGVLGHITFNLAILSLPIALSIYLATEASFTSHSLEAKLVEVQQLSAKTILQEREKRQLLETDELKSRFFANISHEFRTPLSLIKVTIEKLKQKEDAFSQRQTDYTTIDRSANQLLQMINQLLDLSRLEAGKLSLHPQQGDLSELLKVLGGCFSSLFESKGITYRYTVPLQPVWVQVDGDKLEAVVNNLLSNAAKFTPAGGQVSFTATLQAVDAHTCSLQILVQDTGMGIPPSQLPRIFERFYQADSSATRSYDGTGIGLSLVKELVELHGGGVEVQSIEGRGSTFTVRIPFVLADAPKTAYDISEMEMENIRLTPRLAIDEQKLMESTSKRVSHDRIILVVEDNTDLRHFIAGYLSENYKVQEAKDGTEGLRQALETIPDLIISDIMMPGLDGISLCRKLKEDERTSHIPLVLLTAKADAESKMSSLETGVDDYLTKPFSAEELLLRVKNLIQGREKLKEKFSRSFTLQPQGVSMVSVDERFLQKAMAVIEENIGNTEFDVDTFSRELGMSRTQLNRKLTALSGQSPNECIRTIRLKRAAFLLQQQKGNISEVAFMVGFSNPNYFTKCFRDYYGVSPSEYLLSIPATLDNKF